VPSYTEEEAKLHLERLIDEAEAGERVMITRNGKPAAEIFVGLRPAKIKATQEEIVALFDAMEKRRKQRPPLGESSVEFVRKGRTSE
jgi:antitoxin (DNA-binding transcriptional repressor) of toxin-antitoxin stability system